MPTGSLELRPELPTSLPLSFPWIQLVSAEVPIILESVGFRQGGAFLDI